MNTPNKLTLIRTIMIPVLLVFIYVTAIPYHFTIATILLIGVEITDMIDGHLARKHNLITTFGKFLDPLADKVLVLAMLIVLACDDTFTLVAITMPIALIVIIAREFMVSGLRMLAAEQGQAPAAAFWGKLKTMVTMITIVLSFVWLLLVEDFAIDMPDFTRIILEVLIWISVALTVISGILYLKDYWKYIREGEM